MKPFLCAALGMALLPVSVVQAHAEEASCAAPAPRSVGAVWSKPAKSLRGDKIRLNRPYEITSGPRDKGYQFSVDMPGLYQVAVDKKLWIEVVENGSPLPSLRHERAAACTGMHKIVTFQLARGRHVLKFKDAPSGTIRLLIMPVL